jgi:hypothetical protein
MNPGQTHGRPPGPFALMLLACLLVSLIVTARPCRAQSPEPAPAKKIIRYTVPYVFEFGGEVTFTGHKIGSNSKFMHFTLEPTFAAFIVKGFQIGGGPLMFFDYHSYPCPCDSSETLVAKPLGGGLQLFFRYVIDLKHAVFPFIGIGQGFAFAEDLETDVNDNRFFVGPDIGIKLIFRENGILTIFFRYQFTSIGYENVDDREERHDFIFGTGFGFWI